MPGCARRAGRLLGALAFCMPLVARAESPEGRSVGETSWALPGIVRIGVPATGPRRLSLAGAAGYGYTEGQGNGDGAHHRLSGTAAVGFAPLRELELGLRFDGRYDLHPDDGMGSHGGGVGDPRVLVRYGSPLGDGSFRLGGELVAWIPGKDAPSIAFDATTVDVRLLAAHTPRNGPVVAGLLGFRLDNSGKAAPDLARSRPGDRIALGLSDSNAVLAGIGVSVPVQRTEILGEATADLLVGSDSPGVGKSPIRVTGGVRHALTGQLAVEGLLEVLASGRPSIEATAPLAPIEPRFSVMLGLRYRLPFDAPRETVPDVTPTPVDETPKPPPVAAKEAPVVVSVLGPDGTAITGASVEITAGEAHFTAEAAENGYRSAPVPFGDVKVVVKAEGFDDAEKESRHEAGGGAVEVRLETAIAPGQLRGLIRSFSGKGLAATVKVDPLGKETKADAQGNFAIDLPPGDYEVAVTQPGFKPQHRKIHVEQNGVTVLNAELFEGK